MKTFSLSPTSMLSILKVFLYIRKYFLKSENGGICMIVRFVSLMDGAIKFGLSVNYDTQVES